MPLRKWTAVLAMCGLLVLAGCKKKPKTVPPPQAQAPTIEVPAQPQPAPEQPATAPAPAPATTQPATTAPPPTATANAPKPHHPRPPRKTPEKQPAPAQATGTTPKPGTQVAKVNPPATAPEIAPSLPPDQVLHDRGTTEQLLQSTEQNLNSLRRSLSAAEQEMVQQCRVYVTQSRGAIHDGDLARAKVLAMKAHLLSDELVKR